LFVNIIKNMKTMNITENPASVPAPSLNLAQLQASAEKACGLLKALAHADRLVLLCRLSQGEYCVGELEADLGIRQPTLSQQLGVLRQEGLVETRRAGKHIHYRLASADALAVLQVLHERICGTPSAKSSKAPKAHKAPTSSTRLKNRTTS
jgi:DNA-binding transcriptional ArsR family regulator